MGSSWFCTQLATVIIYNFMLHHKFLFHILFFDNLLATRLLYMPFISSNRDVFLIPLRKRRCSQFDVDSEHPKRAITLQLIPTHGKALKWRRKHPLDEVSDSRNAWQNVIVSKFTQIQLIAFCIRHIFSLTKAIFSLERYIVFERWKGRWQWHFLTLILLSKVYILFLSLSFLSSLSIVASWNNKLLVRNWISIMKW